MWKFGGLCQNVHVYDPVAKGCSSIPKYTPMAGLFGCLRDSRDLSKKMDGQLVCAKALCSLKLLAGGPDFFIQASVVWVCLKFVFEVSEER